MKKLLATGLIASVAVASTEASACGNGGFYVGLNAGVALTKAKISHEAHTYAANDKYGATESGWTIGAIAQNDKHISVAAANKRSALADAALKDSKCNKKKTKFLAELVLGYDFRLNDVMMGVEVNVGGIFGSNKLKRNEFTIAAADADTQNGGAAIHANNDGNAVKITENDYAKVKEQWHIALMPRVGYLFTPQFEGYVTFGVKLAKFKTEVDDLPFVATVYSQGNGACANALKITQMKKKSTKAIFLVGAGVRYEFDPALFAKLEYNFEFGAKPKLHKEAMPELKKVKVTSHIIKLGLGCRF